MVSDLSHAITYGQQGSIPFLIGSVGREAFYVLLMGKSLVGNEINPDADVSLSGLNVNAEHCRITVLGQRVLFTPIGDVSRRIIVYFHIAMDLYVVPFSQLSSLMVS